MGKDDAKAPETTETEEAPKAPKAKKPEPTPAERVVAAAKKAGVKPRVKPEHVLSTRETEEGIYAVTAHGHKLLVNGDDVEILTGPGFQPEQEEAEEEDEE